MKGDLLLEIFAEEIPARFSDIYISTVKNHVNEFLKSINQKCDFNVYLTPNRLIVLIKDLICQRESETTEVWGPPEDVAIKEGKKTKAYESFVKKWGIEDKDVEIKGKGGRNYLFAIVKKEYPPTIEEALSLIENIIKKHNFPKSMKWKNNKITYARPIRSILLIHGDKRIEDEILGIKVSNKTFKNFTQMETVEIKSVEEYFDFLNREGEIYDHNERENVVKNAIDSILENGEYLYEDNDLLKEVVFLNEKILPVKGNIPTQFMNLPDKVIIVSMRSHQRYFSVVSAEGELLPYFIAILHNPQCNVDEVKKGLERVLFARLEDAQFYYEEDIKIGIDKMSDHLKDRNFLPKVGTLYERIERMNTLTRRIADIINIEIDDNSLNTINRLLKADLESNMVQGGKEFTKLQGYMGRIYALKNGYSEEIAQVLEEHYLPLTADGNLPQTDWGILFAIADRVDLIVGLMIAGFKITGSKDQGGIRKNIYSIIRIMDEKNIIGDIYKFIDTSYEIYGTSERKGELKEIIKGRLENYFTDKSYHINMVRSVLNNNGNPSDIRNKLETIKKYYGSEYMESVAGGIKRVNNLLKKYPIEGYPNVSIMTEHEKKIYDYVKENFDKVKDLAKNGDYEKVMEILMGCREYIDDLFDNVLIIADEESIKNNRLKLLNYIKEFFEVFADFSYLS